MSTITQQINRSLPWTPRLLKRQSLTLLASGMIALSLSPAPLLAQDQDSGSFWTQFVPSADTRLIFVSTSEGSDTNSGLTPDRPVKSLAKGYELLRDGFPDWMLLKRGDTWYESFPFWTKSGRAEDEKLVVGAYGDSGERPQVRPDPDSGGLRNHGEDLVQHVAFVGFHLEPHNRTVDDGATGISWMRQSNDILFEDLYIAGFSNNIGLQAWPADNLVQNLRLNGCVIVDAWSRNSHSQGLYADRIENLTIENCVFDHNGWNLDMGAQPTIFNHNVYIQHTTSNIYAYNNIFMHGAATGIQMRSGGELINNLFIANPISFHLGAPHGYDLGYGVNAIAKQNTILHGTSIQNTNNTPRSIGAYIYNSKVVEISDNIFAHNEIGYNGQAIIVQGSDNGDDAANINLSNNAFYAWRGPVQIVYEQTPSNDDRILMQGNRFFLDLISNGGNSNFNKKIVDVDEAVNYATFVNNDYRYYGMHNTPFRHGAIMSPEVWSTHEEPTAQLHVLPSIPDDLTISDYLAHIGHPGGIEEFANMARSLSRSNAIDNIRPDAVHAWYRDRLNELVD